MVRIPYKLRDGSTVPSVTTILSRFKDSGGLLFWAWQQGCDGKDFRETRDAAASAGTLAHEMVECEIRGREFQENGHRPEILGKARRAFQEYQRWADQTQLVPVHTEIRLVSENMRVGGTIDAVSVGGLLSLLDWKTSGGVYQEYLCQLAAYGAIWEENHPDEPITGGYHLLRFSKDECDFAHYHWQDLSDARRLFLLYREAYDLDKKLKGRVG